MSSKNKENKAWMSVKPPQPLYHLCPVLKCHTWDTSRTKGISPQAKEVHTRHRYLPKPFYTFAWITQIFRPKCNYPGLEFEYHDFYLQVEIAIQRVCDMFCFQFFLPPRKSIERNLKQFKSILLQYLSIKHFAMDSVNQSSSRIYYGVWKSYPKANFISEDELVHGLIIYFLPHCRRIQRQM